MAYTTISLAINTSNEHFRQQMAAQFAWWPPSLTADILSSKPLLCTACPSASPPIASITTFHRKPLKSSLLQDCVHTHATWQQQPFNSKVGTQRNVAPAWRLCQPLRSSPDTWRGSFQGLLTLAESQARFVATYPPKCVPNTTRHRNVFSQSSQGGFAALLHLLCPSLTPALQNQRRPPEV